MCSSDLAGADSAAKRILSAIDSIARLTGDSTIVRQRRVLADSARRQPPAPVKRP